MEQWVLLENQDLLANLVELVFLEFLEQKEILVQVGQKAVLDFRVQEVKLANLVCLGQLGKWVLLEKMEAMGKKEDQVFLVLQDLQDSRDPEASLV